MAFLATVYVARVLGVEAFGVVGFASAVILYLQRIADGGIELGVGVELISRDPERIESLGGAILSARLLVASLLAGLLAVVGLLVVPDPDGTVLAAYGLTLLAVGGSTKWIHFGLERTGVVAIARILGEILMVGLVLLAVRGPDDLVRVPLAQFVGDGLAALLLLVVLKRWGHGFRFTLDPESVRAVLPRCWPLVAGSLLSLLIYNSDLIFLRFFRGPSSVGYYVAAYAAISFLANLSTAYGNSLLPTLARLDGAEEQSLYGRATVQVVAVALPVAAGGVLLAPQIIELVFGREYAASVLPLQVLLLSVVFGVVREVARVALVVRGREDRLLRMNVIGTGCNLALNLLLIPVWGILGAAWATVATEALRMVLARRFARAADFEPPALQRLWRPAAATALMSIVLTVATNSAPWLSVAVGAVAYAAGLVLTGAVHLRDGRIDVEV